MKRFIFMPVMAIFILLTSCEEYIPTGLGDGPHEIHIIEKKLPFVSPQKGICIIFSDGRVHKVVEPIYDEINIYKHLGFVAVKNDAKTFYAAGDISYIEDSEFEKFSHIEESPEVFYDWRKVNYEYVANYQPHYTIYTTDGKKYALLEFEMPYYVHHAITGPFEGDYKFLDNNLIAYEKDGLWGLAIRSYNISGGLDRTSLEECNVLFEPKYQKIYFVNFTRYTNEIYFEYEDVNSLCYVLDKEGNWKTVDLYGNDVPEEFQISHEVLDVELSYTWQRKQNAKPWKKGVQYVNSRKMINDYLGILDVDYWPSNQFKIKKMGHVRLDYFDVGGW